MLNGKRALVAAILLAWLPLAIGVAYPAVWNWSTTASSNGSADPTINFREGQSPSSVNDSARAMMAALAGYRDDISGSLNTTGTASAYLVSTNQGLPNVPTDGQMLAITVHITNGISPTLSADGGTTYPIQSSAGVAIPAGTLILGSPYSLKFSLTNNAWLLRDFYPSPLIVPLGSMMPYTGTSAPNSNFVLPFGQCISRTTYATYFAQVGTTYGACDGVTTFGVIDMRGNAPVGVDNMGGSSGGRLPGLNLATQTGAATVTIGTGNLPPYTPSGTVANGSILMQVGASPPTPNPTVYTPSGAVASNTGGSVQGVQGTASAITQQASSFSGAAQGGSSSPLPNVQPTIGVNYILRII